MKTNYLWKIGNIECYEWKYYNILNYNIVLYRL